MASAAQRGANCGILVCAPRNNGNNFYLDANSTIMNLIANPTFILRLAVCAVLIMHSVPGMFNNGIHDFGNHLNETGFAPMGFVLAWAIKLSHVAAAIAFLIDRYVRLAGFITIFILVMGIFLVHLPNGWYVVGGGRNGIEFNVLLIAAILTIMYPKGLKN